MSPNPTPSLWYKLMSPKPSPNLTPCPTPNLLCKQMSPNPTPNLWYKLMSLMPAPNLTVGCLIFRERQISKGKQLIVYLAVSHLEMDETTKAEEYLYIWLSHIQRRTNI